MKLTKEVKDTIKMYQANDWEIDSEEPTFVVLKKNTATFGKHVLCFIVVGWWTFGIGNLVYHLISNKKKKIFK